MQRRNFAGNGKEWMAWDLGDDLVCSQGQRGSVKVSALNLINVYCTHHTIRLHGISAMWYYGAVGCYRGCLSRHHTHTTIHYHTPIVCATTPKPVKCRDLGNVSTSGYVIMGRFLVHGRRSKPPVSCTTSNLIDRSGWGSMAWSFAR
jgi:hypothetical protein